MININELNMKKCRICGRELPATAEHWYLRGDKPDGAVCKSCRNKQQSERCKARRAAKRALPAESVVAEGTAASVTEIAALGRVRRLIESAVTGESGQLERLQMDYTTAKMAFFCVLYGKRWRVMVAADEAQVSRAAADKEK